MGITSKTIAPFIAAAISVEGVYEEVEKETVEGLAEELELKDLGKEVEAAFKKIEKLEEDDFDTYLEEAAKNVEEERASEIFDAYVENAEDLEIEA